MRRFTEAEIVGLMDAINSVRRVLQRGRGADPLGEVVYPDADFMTADELTFMHWSGRPATQIAKRIRADENVTPRSGGVHAVGDLEPIAGRRR